MGLCCEETILEDKITSGTIYDPICCIRRWKAGRLYEKKRKAAIRIATIWRGYNLHLSFKEAIRGI
jgi:hypothetical protein